MSGQKYEGSNKKNNEEEKSSDGAEEAAMNQGCVVQCAFIPILMSSSLTSRSSKAASMECAITKDICILHSFGHQ